MQLQGWNSEGMAKQGMAVSSLRLHACANCVHLQYMETCSFANITPNESHHSTVALSPDVVRISAKGL